MEEIVKALLQANIEITKECVSLARAVLESGGMYAQTTPSVPGVPVSFDKFVAVTGAEMSPEEKLFFSEEEEDRDYVEGLHGRTSDPSITKAILKAAGHDDLADQLDTDA